SLLLFSIPLAFLFYLLLILQPRISTLFPYTTLFRSQRARARHGRTGAGVPDHDLLDDQRRRRRCLGPAQADAVHAGRRDDRRERSEEHTSELQSRSDLVCRLLLEKKNKKNTDVDVRD